MERILYSKRFGELASLVIIDGDIVKNRGDEDHLKNTIIQTGDKIKIFCRNEKYINEYRKVINDLRKCYDCIDKHVEIIS